MRILNKGADESPLHRGPLMCCQRADLSLFVREVSILFKRSGGMDLTDSIFNNLGLKFNTGYVALMHERFAMFSHCPLIPR